jgi:hypothetical protein
VKIFVTNIEEKTEKIYFINIENKSRFKFQNNKKYKQSSRAVVVVVKKINETRRFINIL